MPTTSTKQRNVYTIAERRADIINSINATDLSDKDKVIAIINRYMATKGSGASEKVAPITVNGETMYYCNRFDTYFPLDCMVLNKEGEPLTYSKESVAVLTDLKKEYKSQLQSIINGITEAIEAGDFERATELTKQKSELIEPSTDLAGMGITPKECQGYTISDAD